MTKEDKSNNRRTSVQRLDRSSCAHELLSRDTLPISAPKWPKHVIQTLSLQIINMNN